jgi:hypothetical protein
VRVTVFLSFVPFTTPEPRIKGSRANNLQAGIKPASAIEPAAWRTDLSTAVSSCDGDHSLLTRVGNRADDLGSSKLGPVPR